MKKKLLEELREKCANCKACELHKTRTNIVFADGNPDSVRIILIGEAPGEKEDLSGVPFVGRAGKLLNVFLDSADISREKDLYIINTVKCRPPKNRVPSEKEKAACRDFLVSQIDIIKPEIILLCGATALKSFINNINSHVTLNLFQGRVVAQSRDAESSSARRTNKNIPISKIRGEVFEIEFPPSPNFSDTHSSCRKIPSPLKGEGEKKTYKAMAIFHPSYLLRNHSMEENSPRDLMLKDLKKAKSFI